MLPVWPWCNEEFWEWRWKVGYAGKASTLAELDWNRMINNITRLQA